MILECLRIISDALKHPSYGVNAHLATVPLDGNDPMPPLVTLVADETTNGAVARGYVPDTFPSVFVSMHGSARMMGEVMTFERIGHIPIMVGVALSDSQSERGSANVYYTLRAVEQCIRDLMRNTNSAVRTRNDILVFGIEGEIEHMQLTAPEKDGPVTAGLLMTFEVHDTNP